MTTERLWVLGAEDPEMMAIERLLRESGETYCYAVADGQRVHPGNAYRADVPTIPLNSDDEPAVSTVVMVECAAPGEWPMGVGVTVIDHHRPGDPGYGKPPAEFLSASSIGQVCLLLGHLPHADSFPYDVALVAAADHCLAAAYRGECPGVDPDELMRWRIASRAKFQGRTVDEIMADIEAARESLLAAVPALYCASCSSFAEDDDCRTCSQCGGTGRNPRCLYEGLSDLRGRTIPELPEAACIEGLAYLATVADRDGREKVVLGGAATPELVQQFMSGEIVPDLCDYYGDPARGFAGGYVRPVCAGDSLSDVNLLGQNQRNTLKGIGSEIHL